MGDAFWHRRLGGYAAPWFVLLGSLVATSAGCGNAGRRAPIGDSCDIDADCVSGFCHDNRCLDPDGDEDGDTLLNREERAFGSNLFNADSDADGKTDPTETDAARTAPDRDGDGRPDIVESALADADRDCIADEDDGRDDVPDGENSPLVANLCPAAGACIETGATLAVVCPDGLAKPVCDFTRIPAYEPAETTCDARDNDCDGATDEGCDPLDAGLVAHWRMDGNARDASPNRLDGTASEVLGAADRFRTPVTSLQFSASSSFVVADSRHPPTSGSATIAIWVRPDRDDPARGDPRRSTTMGVATFGDESRNGSFASFVLVGEQRCPAWLEGDDDTVHLDACAPPGHWTHYVVVREGRRLTLWRDGIRLRSFELKARAQLASTRLVVGRTTRFSSPNHPENGVFSGRLDDLRLYGRALSDDEIVSLYRNRGWRDAGTSDRPAAHCAQIRETVATASDGLFSLDPDGDGPSAPFAAWCDMETDGGGWTLAWVYGFTRPDMFMSNENAVTPSPAWTDGPFAMPGVPVSNEPPTSPETRGAVPFDAWPDLGQAFRFDAPDGGRIACHPERGSLTALRDGALACRHVDVGSGACAANLPRWLFTGSGGPGLAVDAPLYYWTTRTDAQWPIHDRCGTHAAPTFSPNADTVGRVWLRPARAPMRLPRECNELLGRNRRNAWTTIDPDQAGSLGAIDAECDFSTAMGGFTRLSERTLASSLQGVMTRRRFLFETSSGFYVSPPTTARFDTDAGRVASGLWLAGADRIERFTCLAATAGDVGIGCSNDIEGLRVVDWDGMTATVCETGRAFLGDATTACTEGVRVWVRNEANCAPQGLDATGDATFAALLDTMNTNGTPGCWEVRGANITVVPDTDGALVTLRRTGADAPHALVHPRVQLAGARAWHMSLVVSSDADAPLHAVVRRPNGDTLFEAFLVSGTTPETILLPFELSDDSFDVEWVLQSPPDGVGTWRIHRASLAPAPIPPFAPN